jgi:hypothetical protein
VIVMILLPALRGMVGMSQFAEPCATPVAPLLVVQLTATVPEPPEAVPLIEIHDAVLEAAGATTASRSGLTGADAGAGAGAGAGLGLAAVLAAAYNSWAASMSSGIRTVCMW